MSDIYYVKTNIWVFNKSFSNIEDAKAYLRYLYKRNDQESKFKHFKTADLLLNGKKLLVNLYAPTRECIDVN